MSESKAPETLRLWCDPDDGLSGFWTGADEWNGTYRRADLPWLPDHAVKWLETMREEIIAEGHNGWANTISDILAAVGQKP